MAENNDYEEFKKLLEEEGESTCESCGGKLKIEKVNLEDFQGGKLYVMEKVPSFVCEECSETWVPEQIMDEFKKMISTAKEAHKSEKTIKKGKGKK